MNRGCLTFQFETTALHGEASLSLEKPEEKPEEKPDPLRELDVRLRDARAERQRDKAEGTGRLTGSNMSGFGIAFRVGAELVSALIVGVLIGYMLDNWLDTAPWFLIVFFFIGAGAGILNVYRAANGLVGGGPAGGEMEGEMEIDDYSGKPGEDEKEDS